MHVININVRVSFDTASLPTWTAVSSAMWVAAALLSLYGSVPKGTVSICGNGQIKYKHKCLLWLYPRLVIIVFEKWSKAK